MAISKERLEEIEAFVDEDISDIPELTPEEGARLRPAREVTPWLYKPLKKRISIYVDADVIEHLKSKGKGYQTKINRILRQDMLRETAPSYGEPKATPEKKEDA